MTALRRTPDGAAADLDLRCPAPQERDALFAWLDEGLRDGRKGRLASEYPTLLDPERGAVHRIACVGEAFAAHAVSRTITVRVAGRSLRLGMIGLVYTDPRFRRRGLASACIEACVADLAADGATAALLWSDRHAFYRRLGFVPAGRELLVRVDPGIGRAAAERLGGAEPIRVGPPEPADWPALEALLAGQPSHALREPGDLARLAAAPDCALRVARAGGRPVAYAACGRGDDFPGVVHEWAGAPGGVAACIRSFAAERADLLVLAGPKAPEPIGALRAAGAVTFPGALALVRLLDPAALCASLAAEVPDFHLGGTPEAPWLEAAGERVAIEPPDALALLIGPEIPPAVRRAVPPASARGLHTALPAPVFVWGFDSI